MRIGSWWRPCAAGSPAVRSWRRSARAWRRSGRSSCARTLRGLGLGRLLIDELRGRARAHGFEQLCAFTHAPAYFARLGFASVPHCSVPEKIAADCRHCSLFGSCGQYAMVTELAPAAASWHLGVLPPSAVSRRRPGNDSVLGGLRRSVVPGPGLNSLRRSGAVGWSSCGWLRSSLSPARWRARRRHRSTKRSASGRRAWPARSSRSPTIRRPPGGIRRVWPRAPTSAAASSTAPGRAPATRAPSACR